MRNQSQIYLHINPGGAQLNAVLISIICTHIKITLTFNQSASTCTQLSYIHKRNNLIFMIMSNYGSWSLPQLKDELRKRKAQISGRKHELIER